jgi:hypothetical protein
VKKLIGITAVVLYSVVAACGQPPNPLLGNWHLSALPGTTSSPYCATSMVFTATTQTLTYAGKAGTENVHYNAAQTAVYPTTVYVPGNTASHTTYNFSSKDRVVQDTAALCAYQRD